MRVEERLETITKKVYIAEDGTEFNDPHSCEGYEFMEKMRLTGKVVYTVHHKVPHKGSVEVFSTRELAEKSLERVEKRQDWVITEQVMDWRFIR